MSRPRVTGLLLAAGGSKRLGQPKQLLPFGGATLLDHTLATARACQFDQLICVIGGAQLFAATLPLADRVVLTEVDLAPEGDTRLALDLAGWREVSREDVAAGPDDDAAFSVRVLERA